MTPSPTPGHVEERLRSALSARAAQITPDQLTHADPPAAARNRSPRWVAAGALAACAAGAVVVVTLDQQRDAGFAVAAGTGHSLAGVGYDLPSGWSAVDATAPPGLRRACLGPDGSNPGGDGTCPALELMVADPVEDPDDGGALGTDDLGVDACGDDYHVQWRLADARIDGAPADLNTVRCTPSSEPRTFWTLDGWNAALFVRDARWNDSAETVLASMRISAALRETAETAASQQTEPTATPSPHPSSYP